MNEFQVKKILVPLDGSQTSFHGLEKGIYFARQCKAEITGLCIAFVPPNLVFETVEKMDSATRKKIDELLEKSKTICAKDGINFRGEIDHGDPSSKILEFANKWNFDLIVMGSVGAGSKESSFLGSVANSVLEKSKIPVLIVK